MDNYRYIIIGGGIAGGKACEGIREIDKSGSLALITQEHHQPYQRPPLSKAFLRNEVGLEKVYLQEPGFYKQNDVELLLGISVLRIEPKQTQIVLSDGRELGYEKLLLATGGRARKLDIPGSELKNVFLLRTIEDAKSLQAASRSGKRALVIGGSFIGAEVSASLSQMGMEVFEIFPESRLLERVVPNEVSQYLLDLFDKHAVKVMPDTIAKGIYGNGSVEKIELENGERIDADLVVMGAGIDLNTELAQEAGIELREADKAVIVDESLRTNTPHIYAAGDIAAWPDRSFHKRMRVEHWDVARGQGWCAGQNMAGGINAYQAIPYFFSDLFDLSFEVWGDLSSWDQTIQRGTLPSGSFAFFYFSKGGLVGVLAVDPPDTEREPMQSMVEAHVAYDDVKDTLRDEHSELSEIGVSL